MHLDKKYYPDENCEDIDFGNKFLDLIKDLYNEKGCYMCKSGDDIPEEGVIIRVESSDFIAYKAKSNRFYNAETISLDSGEVDIETDS